MARVCSILTLLLACFVFVGTLRADDTPPPKKHKPQSPEKRFDAMEKAANHDPLTGVLTKDEFVSALKTVSPKQADKADNIFTKIKKADDSKVTKDEYVTAMKLMHGRHKHKDKDADKDADSSK